ncbi:conserved hypothetical protein [Nitrosotalea sinensis]|uniref:Uncharacterized protein n=1 Tax=Nitrosotalea sinensis TaxID=1499975 RepID=A0A2H1EI35_9ARCH|nr:hypothetical protein [Candidatus Nitrosotalea sinensis]SHO46981.1 conserved hypothetical protein [Candidatus Nitrosotalea sinensis]
MWTINPEEDYFKIYDDNKTLVGYFAPEYGDIQPEDKAYQVRQEMLKNHDLVKSGYLMLPMVKFGIFEDGKDMTIDYVEQQLRLVHVRILAWKNLLTEKNIAHHKILVSHTDHDMLSITLGIIFTTDIPLEKTKILDTLSGVLDFAQERGLL